MEYKHYIKIDEFQNIIEGFSNAFHQPQEGDICITENGGRHFDLFGEINPELKNLNGTYIYKYINENIIKVDNEIKNKGEI